MKSTILNEIQNYLKISKYNSFQSLTEEDLYDIAKWGLTNEFSLSGVWDETEDIEVASKLMVDRFIGQLNTNYPEGFKNIPDNPTIYRIIVLEDIKDFNKNNLGFS